MLTKKPGQLAGLASTARSACIQRAATAGGGAYDTSKPHSRGLSRTTIQVSTASASEARPRPTKTERQDVTVTNQARGAPAAAAPRFPASRVMPLSVAKRCGGNQLAHTLSRATKVTATPTPTSTRPTAAHSQPGARPNRIEPNAATTAPAVTMMRGPMVSASTPTGICRTV